LEKLRGDSFAAETGNFLATANDNCNSDYQLAATAAYDKSDSIVSHTPESGQIRKKLQPHALGAATLKESGGSSSKRPNL